MFTQTGLGALNFKSKRAGKPVRAAPWIRAYRLLRRKRVAYARLAAAHALKRAQAEINRVYALASVYDVPVDPMAPLPVLPLMPNQDWIECKRGLGKLAEAIRPAQAATS
jgi:hypothetical protein